MDPRLRRYYEALVRHDRRDEQHVGHAVNRAERSDVNALMCVFATIILLMAAAFFACLFLFVDTAQAHDAARPDLNHWFDGLASGKGPCCSKADGQTVLDADWESIDGHYRVRLENRWIVVPRDAVVEQPNLDGQTIVWPMHINGETSVRCFMPGVMG